VAAILYLPPAGSVFMDPSGESRHGVEPNLPSGDISQHWGHAGGNVPRGAYASW
jgi:hypothetical protein